MNKEKKKKTRSFGLKRVQKWDYPYRQKDEKDAELINHEDISIPKIIYQFLDNYM